MDVKFYIYQQGLICFVASMNEQRAKNGSNGKKLVRLCANNVVQEVLAHQNKAKIVHIKKKKIAERVKSLHKE